MASSEAPKIPSEAVAPVQEESAALPSLSNSAFEEVSFIAVRAFYPPSEDIEVQLTVGASVETSSRDWIGLYKVGWKTPKDYYTFEWAPSRNEDAQFSSVVFQARRLPRDESSSFQFCYVTKSGEVRGVSTPFQVKDYVDEDLECIEVHDDNLESLVLVNSRTADSRMEHYREQNAMLESTIQRTKVEFSVLQEQLEQAEIAVSAVQLEKKTLSEEIQQANNASDELTERLARKEKRLLQLQSDLENSAQQVNNLQVLLKEKTDALKEATDAHNAVADENRVAMVALQEQNELLVSEVMAKSKVIASYTERFEELKKECVELKAVLAKITEENASSMQEMAEELTKTREQARQDNDELRIELTECMKAVAEKEDALLACQTARDDHIADERRRVEDLEGQQVALRVQVSELEEELRTAKSAQECMPSDISLCNISELMGERADMERELTITRQRVVELEEELSQSKTSDEGALYALRRAYNHSEQVREELSREREALRQQLRVKRAQKTTVGSLEGEVEELQSKNKDLERRLELGAQAYKEKFVELRTANRQLEQLKEQQSRSALPESEQVDRLSKLLAEAQAELAKRDEQRVALEQAVTALTEERDSMEQSHLAALQAVKAESDEKILALNMDHEEEKEQFRRQCEEQSSLIQSLMSEPRPTAPVPPAPVHDRARPTPHYPDSAVHFSRGQSTVTMPSSTVEVRTCPICNSVFPPNKTQDEYERHVDSHFRHST